METIAEKSEEEPPVEITDEMRAAAAAFGRIGGRIGGPARAVALSAKKRSEIAKKAATARWQKRRK
ncbi:MAG: RNA-binding protein [Acidobacteria bacterium]|nr:RNA-binding protein [Acidobacteriota bacterium]MBV9475309.1 RNA-binding protein [Acidobacteriota bacterium]